MNKRIYFLLIIIFSVVSSLSAKSILPETALERALNSESGPYTGARIKTVAVQAEYTLAYSASSGSYYVFNRSTGGYIVVSGDDRIYPILADVTSGVFSKEEIAPAAEYILETYDNEIQAFSDSGEYEPGIMEYYGRWTAIDPLMSTKWNQDYPYNIYCPAIGSQTCVTGCVATAMAQVVRCIGYYNGSGYRSYNGINAAGEPVEYDFEANSFDFDKMYDFYPSSVSEESIDQVGRLMLACGLAAGMNYGVSESGAYTSNVPNALSKYFGYDSKYTRMYYRENFTQAQWENMLYSQLQLGRPLYYSGSGSGGSHAFVVDGYRPAGLYHVNWGWGGSSDGYFRLSALNPSQTGIGGSSGGFSLGQSMVTVVPPDADPGATISDMSGSISMVDDGVYSLYYMSNGVNFVNVSIGAAIVDSSGKIVASATFWPAQTFTGSSALRHDSYHYDFSNISLSPGVYRIYPAFQSAGEEYVITGKCMGRQYYINLNVTEQGEYVLTNPPVTEETSDIKIAGIIPEYDLHVGFSGMISFYVVNDGNMDYEGVIGLTMLDSAGEEVASILSTSSFIAAGANSVMYAPYPAFDKSNNLIQAGVYSLRFTDGNGDLLSDGEFSIEIKSGTPRSSWTSTEGIEVTNYASVPNAFISGDSWQHIPFIKTKETHRNMSLYLALYKPSSTSATNTFLCYHGTIGPMESTLFIDPFIVDVPFGIYEVCYRKAYSQISPRTLLRVGVAVNGLYYLPASGDGVSVSMMQNLGAKKEIIIPEHVAVDGINRPVTAIEPEAFMTDASLSVVEMPSGLETIGANAFSLCPSLDQIIMHSDEPPFVFRNYIAPGLDPATAFYVPAVAYDKYKLLLEKYNPVYTLVETIESGSETLNGSDAYVSLSFSPAHEAVDHAFVITPADEISATVADAELASVEAGKLNIKIKALRKGEATFHVRPAHRSDRYAILTVNVPEPTSVEDISADYESQWPADVYTVTGFQLKRNASADYIQTLPQGIYILRTPYGVRKVIR